MSQMTAEKQSQYLGEQATTLGFFAQVGLLTFKNLLITFKNPKNILFLIITPFILGLFLYALQYLAISNGDLTQANPPVTPLPGFSPCSWSDECVSLEISYVTNNASKNYSDYPWIDEVLSSVKSQTGVNYQKRMTPITSFSTLQDYYT